MSIRGETQILFFITARHKNLTYILWPHNLVVSHNSLRYVDITYYNDKSRVLSRTHQHINGWMILNNIHEKLQATLWDTINWTTLRHFRLVDLFTARNYLFYSYYYSVIQQSVVPSTSLHSRVFSDLQKYINFSLSTAQPDIDCISHCNPNPKESEMNQVCFEKMTNEIATARDTIPITKYFLSNAQRALWSKTEIITDLM